MGYFRETTSYHFIGAGEVSLYFKLYFCSFVKYMIPSIIESITIPKCSKMNGIKMTPNGAKALLELINTLPAIWATNHIINNPK